MVKGQQRLFFYTGALNQDKEEEFSQLDYIGQMGHVEGRICATWDHCLTFAMVQEEAHTRIIQTRRNAQGGDHQQEQSVKLK